MVTTIEAPNLRSLRMQTGLQSCPSRRRGGFPSEILLDEHAAAHVPDALAQVCWVGAEIHLLCVREDEVAVADPVGYRKRAVDLLAGDGVMHTLGGVLLDLEEKGVHSLV
jgi:hypothetical protein